MRSSALDSLPPAVRRSLIKLGADISIARRKRNLTTTMVAERIGAAKSTYLKVQKGDPSVSIGIYAFWTFLMRFLPHIREHKSRSLLFGCMLLGSAMIIAMSAWLNASALAGAAAIQQHLANAVQAYTRDLDQAHNNALAAQSLLPDIQMASTRFARLADAEKAGSLTGTSGSGTVVQLLTQMSTQLSGLADEVAQSAERVKALYDQGGKRLAAMRELVSDRGPISARTDRFGGEALELMGVIASLQQTSVAPAVKRAADGLAAGFIWPACARAAPCEGRACPGQASPQACRPGDLARSSRLGPSPSAPGPPGGPPWTWTRPG